MNRTARIVIAAACGVAGVTQVARAARTQVATIPAGTTARYGVAASNGAFVIVSSGSANTLSVIDGRSFTALSTPLTLTSGGTSVKSLTVGVDSTPEIAAGTVNGRVQQWTVTDIGGFADGSPVPTPTVVRLAGTPGAVTGVAINSTGTRLFAADGTNKTVTAFDDTTGVAVSGALALGHTPIVAADVHTGFVERVFFGTNDGNLAWIDAGTLLVSVFTVDVTQTHRISALAVGTFAGPAPRLAVIDETANTLLLIDPAVPAIVQSLSLLSHPVAVAISGAEGTAEIWVAEDSSTGGSNQVEAFTPALASSQAAVPLSAAPLSLTEANGYLWAGLAGGNLALITDRPYLDITSVSPNPLSARGTDVSVNFTSTEGGSATVFVNGASVATAASVLANTPTTITVAGAQLGSTVLLEGKNRFRLELAGGTSGLLGHDESSLKLDLPPPTPGGFQVGFGDGKVIASWNALDLASVPDFKEYVVRFGTGAFGTNGVPSLSSPQTTTGTLYSVLVSNGTTVFMSIMAKDSAGNLSHATTVLSATAQPTEGAAEIAGDKGGFILSCGVGRIGPGARGLASLLGASIALLGMRGFFRRRERDYPRGMDSEVSE